jgi:hypothetical protein
MSTYVYVELPRDRYDEFLREFERLHARRHGGDRVHSGQVIEEPASPCPFIAVPCHWNEEHARKTRFDAIAAGVVIGVDVELSGDGKLIDSKIGGQAL